MWYAQLMHTKAIILRIIFILLIVVDFVTALPWAFTIMAGITAVPLALTIALLVMHLRSFRQIGKIGKVSHRLMFYQLIVGGILAFCVAIVVGFLSSLDCLDVCTGVPASRGYLFGTITFLICMTPMLLIYWLNSSLVPLEAPLAPVNPAEQTVPVVPPSDPLPPSQ